MPDVSMSTPCPGGSRELIARADVPTLLLPERADIVAYLVLMSRSVDPLDSNDPPTPDDPRCPPVCPVPRSRRSTSTLSGLRHDAGVHVHGCGGATHVRERSPPGLRRGPPCSRR